MKRKSFLKISTLVMLAPLLNSESITAAANNYFSEDIELLQRLVAANDQQVTTLLQTIKEGNITFSRKIGYDYAALVSAYASPGSMYYHIPLLISKLDLLNRALISQQAADGTVNIGNLESPPDTAFLVELLTAAAFILTKDHSNEAFNVNAQLKTFLINAGNALTSGGVHTPNHRWVISAALSRLNALYPNKKYVNRIEEWLSEGVYQDKDGHYPERSAIYSGVENAAFISIGRLLNKPFLLNYVRKNLELMYYYMEPNGDVVTTDSRRQDQYLLRTNLLFYFQYRYLAIKDNNRKFAAITKFIETNPDFDEQILNKGLFHYLEEPLLLQQLPASILPTDNYEKLFTSSHLLRIKRGKTTTTLFGGVDWPLTIASGQSNSPNFFSYRKGNAILKYMRLSSGFFGMGYFYSEGIKKEENQYILHKKLEVPYYQPLPKEKRNSKGDYLLSPSTDERFWNKMDFNNRPQSNIKTLSTKIIFSENNDFNELDFEVTGLAGVPVTIELCFLEGGKLSGVSEPVNGNSFLENGTGQYEFGGDVISFGPGAAAHKKITELEGERYSTHFGSLRTEGMHVYITGVTPFRHKLIIS